MSDDDLNSLHEYFDKVAPNGSGGGGDDNTRATAQTIGSPKVVVDDHQTEFPKAAISTLSTHHGGLRTAATKQPPRVLISPTPFGINRFLLLGLVITYCVLIGSHFFNWTPWEKILVEAGAFRDRCPPDTPADEVCTEQRGGIARILPVTSVCMFSFTFLAGLVLDIIGAKICCIFGNCLLILGWGLLSLSPSSPSMYIVGFAFVGAGTDPAFFGTLSVANLFPGHGSTIIALLGAARSLSNLWPLLLYAVSSDTFEFPQMAYVFIAVYCGCLIFVAFLIPSKPYDLPVAVGDVASATATDQLLIEQLSVPQVHHTPSFSVQTQMDVATIGAAPAMTESQTSPKEEGVVVVATLDSIRSPSFRAASFQVAGSPLSMIEPGGDGDDVFSRPPPKGFKAAWATLVRQLATLARHLTSSLFYPVVIITITNVIRNNFFLTSATKQLGSAETLLSILNVLAFIPGPICGLLVDRFGPVSMLTALNTTNMIVFVALLIGEPLGESGRLAFSYISVVFAFPGIGFLLSQIYCYIAVYFPPSDLGKLAGFASLMAGVCGLVVDPMYSLSLSLEKFWPMNLVNVGTSILNYVLLIFILISLRRLARKKSEKEGRGVDDSFVVPIPVTLSIPDMVHESNSNNDINNSNYEINNNIDEIGGGASQDNNNNNNILPEIGVDNKNYADNNQNRVDGKTA